MNDRTGIYGGNTTVYRYLSEDGRFWVVSRVINGFEEKGTANRLTCFSEQVLGAIRGARVGNVE